MCGADFEGRTATVAIEGSSPRVRSRLALLDFHAAELGIISACAEQTMATVTWSASHRDHLRVCGADEVDLFEAMCHQGSSPRVRSRPRQRYHGRAGTGIISACAEQTRQGWRRVLWRKDHLRVCGADHMVGSGVAHRLGSSPRVRSRLGMLPPDSPPVGIISACAEQTNGADDIERV